MATTKAGSIYTEIRARLNKYENDLKKAGIMTDRGASKIQKRINKISFSRATQSMAKFSRAFNTLTVGIAAAAGGGGALGVFLRLNTGYENSIFRLRQTFQENTDAMIQKAREMSLRFEGYYNFQDISYAFTKTADSMQRYGIIGERYIDLVARAAEIGAAKNLELRESIDRIESAMRGEAEASEYLGITLNDTYLKNIAFDGALKDTWETMTDLEKAQHRFNELMIQTAKYQGSAKEAADTLSGAWKSLTNTIVDKLSPSLTTVNDTLVHIIHNMRDAVREGRFWKTLLRDFDILLADPYAWAKRVTGREFGTVEGREIFRAKVPPRPKIGGAGGSTGVGGVTSKPSLTPLQTAAYAENLRRLSKGMDYGAVFENMEKKSEESFDSMTSDVENFQMKTEKSFSMITDLSERTAWSMQQTFSNLFFDAMQGKLRSFRDYATAILNSIQRSIADVASQMLVSGLFGALQPETVKGTAKTPKSRRIPVTEWQLGASGRSHKFHPNEVVTPVGKGNAGINVDINVHNNLGQQADVRQTSSWVSPDRVVADIVLNRKMTSRGFRQGLK